MLDPVVMAQKRKKFPDGSNSANQNKDGVPHGTPSYIKTV